MMRIRIVLASLALVASACGGGGQAGTGSAEPGWDPVTFASALQGTWRNACGRQATHGDSYYWDSRYTFSARIDHWDSAYTDPACASFAGSGHEVHCDAPGFAVGAATTVELDGRQVTALPVDMCFSGWPATAAYYFSLYMDPADRTRVYGLGRWGTTAEGRPTTIDPAQTWVKQ